MDFFFGWVLMKIVSAACDGGTCPVPGLAGCNRVSPAFSSSWVNGRRSWMICFAETACDQAAGRRGWPDSLFIRFLCKNVHLVGFFFSGARPGVGPIDFGE